MNNLKHEYTGQQYEPAECNPARPRSNAGMNAMLEAIKKGFTTLYMFGFDFILDDPKGIVTGKHIQCCKAFLYSF